MFNICARLFGFEPCLHVISFVNLWTDVNWFSFLLKSVNPFPFVLIPCGQPVLRLFTFSATPNSPRFRKAYMITLNTTWFSIAITIDSHICPSFPLAGQSDETVKSNRPNRYFIDRLHRLFTCSLIVKFILLDVPRFRMLPSFQLSNVQPS